MLSRVPATINHFSLVIFPSNVLMIQTKARTSISKTLAIPTYPLEAQTHPNVCYI